MDKFKGLTIELISNADIKYKGILQDIDPENSEITLTKVRCLGSEKRGIPESPRLFDSIRFKSSDIKDLVIDEKVEKKTVSKPITKSQPTFEELEEKLIENEPLEQLKALEPLEPSEPLEPMERKDKYNYTKTDNVQHNDTQRRGRKTRGRGRGRRGRNKQNIPKEDYDFAKNIDKFQKMSLEEPEEDKFEKAYDKQSSFFDSLSNERTTINRHEERDLNMETFGTARVYRPRRGRGRYPK